MPEEPTLPEIIRALTKVNDRHSQALHDQSESFRDRLRVKDNKISDQRRALATCDRTLERRDAEIELLREVIGELCHRIERAQSQLRRDNQNCVYPEPLEIMDLLGRETDPGKVIRILRDRKERAARQKMAPCPNFVQNPEPEKPNVPCSLHKGHAGYCIVKAPENPRPCPLRIVEDCAGTEGHPGPCTPNADDIPSVQEVDPADTDLFACQFACTHPAYEHNDQGCAVVHCGCKYKGRCRICGHHCALHSKPQEGVADFCVECEKKGGSRHLFDGSAPKPEDRCYCGCSRKLHIGNPGAQCKGCPGDEERSWRHEFFMETEPPSEPVCVYPGCGHPEERHTTSLPEEGRRKYCTECSEHNEFHAFVSGD